MLVCVNTFFQLALMLLPSSRDKVAAPDIYFPIDRTTDDIDATDGQAILNGHFFILLYVDSIVERKIFEMLRKYVFLSSSIIRRCSCDILTVTVGYLYVFISW